jgi:orotidine-5'-phosphate decarboxylase
VSSTGASLLTIHAGGGEKMMRAAAEAAYRPGAPRLLAVTVLTSMDPDELQAVGVRDRAGAGGVVEAQVLRLARLAREAGIDGLVCSPQEVAAVRELMGPDAMLVVPGIRPGGSRPADDQSRVATAAQAIAGGASKLVVGRPITQAPDPARAAEQILAEIGRVR